jgi:hypothetical protein
VLLSVLLVGALGCGRAEDDGSSADDPGASALTERDIQEIYESSPGLREDAAASGEVRSEMARGLRDRMKSILAGDPTEVSAGEWGQDHAGAALAPGTSSDPLETQGKALWIGLALIGATLFAAVIAWLVRGLRDGFTGLERSERRMKRRYLERCERTREERGRGVWAP